MTGAKSTPSQSANATSCCGAIVRRRAAPSHAFPHRSFCFVELVQCHNEGCDAEGSLARGSETATFGVCGSIPETLPQLSFKSCVDERASRAHRGLEKFVVCVVMLVAWILHLRASCVHFGNEPRFSCFGGEISLSFRLASIEELAGRNRLCSDKTGTLTQNIMIIEASKQQLLMLSLSATLCTQSAIGSFGTMLEKFKLDVQ